MNDILLRYRFRLLLVASVLLTLVMGWPAPPLWLEWGCLLGLVLAGINTLRHKRLFQQLALWIGGVNLLLLGLDQLIVLPQALSDGLGLIAFYLLLCATLFHRVTGERPVTKELLYGLCALYLQLGMAFAFAFQVVSGLVPGAFNSVDKLLLDDFVYYSLATLTTVGYGDIHAIAPAARLLAGAEAVMGVMFIALLVARSLALMHEEDEEEL
ncbi:Ion channel [compost metagenome]|uniref:Ion channel n=1 Tax=Pseudomonas linyingensis TaxID=915471 RepID=A0A1H6W2L1_9PSED|nr:potassium channel family protein [Pseudomonas linyingensis]MCM2320836.1 potassium channel family protein [Pseudomonas sp.]SEJ06752.1 Ion channel [Pseudomonas linyingensis]